MGSVGKVKHIQEGGNDTKYFHLVANGKHRRKKIFQLDQDEGDNHRRIKY
jgi:hypothetical protein